MEITEEVKQKMIEYLQTFEQGVKRAGEFSAEQAPMVVQEFLAWEFWGNAIPAVLVLLIMLTAVISTAVIWKKSDDIDWRMGSGVVTVLAVVFLTIPFSITASQACKVAIAPRIVVLEKISELVR